MSLNFAPAVRSEAKARVALVGPTGAGKTWTALEWANTLGDRIGVIDTENASASLYADRFNFQTAPWWPPYDATKLAAAIKDAAAQYDVLVLDSLTHFWAGDGGVLDIVDREAQRNRGNSYAGWKVGTPIWRGLLDALIFAPCHVVVTMRSKMDYVMSQNGDGRAKVEKVGMAPVARNDVEYEFTIVGELDHSHRLTITKSRCADLADKVAAPHQAGQLAGVLRDWLGSAAAAPALPARGETSPADPPTDNQRKRAQILAKELWGDDRAARLTYWSLWVGYDVGSFNDLTAAAADDVIERMQEMKRKGGSGAASPTEVPPSPSGTGAVVAEPSTLLDGASAP